MTTPEQLEKKVDTLAASVETMAKSITDLKSLSLSAAGVCPTCEGKGEMFGKECPECEGTGEMEA